MRTGCQVVGCTIYDWSLEFGQHRGFLVDQRGTYKCDIFIEQEDVKLAATAFLAIFRTGPGLRLFFNKAAGKYWNSAHIMVQAENVGDVLKTLYSWCVADQEYDHSGVH